MIKQKTISKNTTKYRLTAFIDPAIARRAKIHGALENLTLSEVVEKALDAYAPKIEKNSAQYINLKFTQSQSIGKLTPEADMRSKRIVPKHTKNLVVPR